MPVRLCLEPGCPNTATGKGRCDEHRRERERERSARRRANPDQARAIVVYHSKRWLVLRRHVLNRDPICRMCDERLSCEVDHIRPMSEGGAEYDPKNLAGLCTDCHRRKSAREAAARQG
jgi:5-methylcytosine-specific restriction endonuclease McrA